MRYAKSTIINTNQLHSGWQATENSHQTSYHSPVPQLIELLEPILEKVKAGDCADIDTQISAFISILELSRREIDELENLANFLRTTASKT